MNSSKSKIIGVLFVSLVTLFTVMFIILRSRDNATAFSFVPAPIILSGNEETAEQDYEKLKNKVAEVIEPRYNEFKDEANELVEEYMDDEYHCGQDREHTCYIDYGLDKEVDDIAKNIAFTAIAVNNTLLYFDDSLNTEPLKNYTPKYDENGVEDMNAKMEYMSKLDNEYFNSSSNAMMSSIKRYVTDMMMIPIKEIGWIIHVDEELVHHSDEYYDDQYDPVTGKTEKKLIYVDNWTEHVYKGSIVVPVIIRADAYKADIVNAAIIKKLNEVNKGKSPEEQYTLDEFKADYVKMFYVNAEMAGTFYKLTIDEINEALFASASQHTLDGVDPFDGSVEYADGDWSIINAFADKHGLYHNQCTTYVNYQLYATYGIIVGGNGNQMAENLVNKSGDKFEYGSGPSAGGIVSVPFTKEGGTFGHVFYVTESKYDEEGNLTYLTVVHGNPGIYKNTFSSWDDWDNYIRGLGSSAAAAVYANPTQEKA